MQVLGEITMALDYQEYKNVVSYHIKQLSNCNNALDIADRFDDRINNGWRFGDACIEVARDIISKALS